MNGDSRVHAAPRSWGAALALLFLAACHRETPQEPRPAAPAPLPQRKIQMVPAPPPPPVRASTPKQCAGDGSYAKAVDCFRIAAGFHFDIVDGHSNIAGDMSRPRLGTERVRFSLDGQQWTAITELKGVTWYRGKTRETAPPPVADRVYQRTTLLLDPQKKEGSPQLAGVERINGEECNHYRFTDANNGSAYDAWVSTRDGRLVKLAVATPPPLRSVMPPMTMTVTHFGDTTAIEAPQ